MIVTAFGRLENIRAQTLGSLACRVSYSKAADFGPKAMTVGLNLQLFYELASPHLKSPLFNEEVGSEDSVYK